MPRPRAVVVLTAHNVQQFKVDFMDFFSTKSMGQKRLVYFVLNIVKKASFMHMSVLISSFKIATFRFKVKIPMTYRKKQGKNTYDL